MTHGNLDDAEPGDLHQCRHEPVHAGVRGNGGHALTAHGPEAARAVRHGIVGQPRPHAVGERRGDAPEPPIAPDLPPSPHDVGAIPTRPAARVTGALPGWRRPRLYRRSSSGPRPTTPGPSCR